MMYNNIFDTHSHYDDKKFGSDRKELLSELQGKGITKVVSCGCDLETTELNKQLAD